MVRLDTVAWHNIVNGRESTLRAVFDAKAKRRWFPKAASKYFEAAFDYSEEFSGRKLYLWKGHLDRARALSHNQMQLCLDCRQGR